MERAGGNVRLRPVRCPGEQLLLAAWLKQACSGVCTHFQSAGSVKLHWSAFACTASSQVTPGGLDIATRGADRNSTRACRVEFGALLAEPPGLPRNMHAGCGVVAWACVSRECAAAVWVRKQVQQGNACTQRACSPLPLSRLNNQAPVCQTVASSTHSPRHRLHREQQLTNAVLHVELRGQLRAAVGHAAACRLAALAALAREQLLLIQLSGLYHRLPRTIGSACTGAAGQGRSRQLRDQGVCASRCGGTAAAAARPGICVGLAWQRAVWRSAHLGCHPRLRARGRAAPWLAEPVGSLAGWRASQRLSTACTTQMKPHKCAHGDHGCPEMQNPTRPCAAASLVPSSWLRFANPHCTLELPPQCYLQPREIFLRLAAAPRHCTGPRTRSGSPAPPGTLRQWHPLPRCMPFSTDALQLIGFG